MTEKFNAIRDCPLDVLKYIFEEAVVDVSLTKCLKIATIFSHVCRRWRMAALDTPKLWLYIDCDMTQDEDAIKDFWKRAPGRVRGLPATVQISNVGAYTKLLLRHSKLESIPHIELLTLQLCKSKGINEINHRYFVPPKGVLQQLRIVASPEVVTGVWDCGRLLSRFPPLGTLTLERLSGVMLAKEKTFPTITKFILQDAKDLSLDAVMFMFPSLTWLELRRTTFNGFINDEVTFPHLKYLKINEMYPRRWLENILCPVLRHLVIDESVGMRSWMYWALGHYEHIRNFVSDHRSITSLELPRCDRVMELSQIAPQLLHLRMYGLQSDWWEVNPDPIFPFLRTLGFDSNAWPCTEAVFVEFVRHRCLPITHSQSRLITSDPLESIKIYTHKHDNGVKFAWEDHPLFKEAKRSAFSHNGDGEMCISLSWIES